MSLVFFDIECASVNKTSAKICAFGYVVCDEQFNILEKEDILVNPRGGFHLTDRKGDKGLVLPYEYEEFKHHPTFPVIYPFIKRLLEDRSSFVIGHSTMNDIKYLNLETKRFNLPSFRFEFSDSQLMYMAHINDFSRQFGLEYIAQSLGVEFTPHRAADDAYATMRIVQELCTYYRCDYRTLIQKLSITNGRISRYCITAPVSAGMKQFAAERRRERIAKSAAREKFFDYVNRKRMVKGKFKGAVFTFSRAIEDNTELARELVDLVYANGGRYSQHVTHSRYYIIEEGDDSARTRSARALDGLKIYDIESFRRLTDE